MSITITITPTDAAEAQRVIALLFGLPTADATPPADAKPTRTRRTKAEIEAAQAAEAKPMSEVAPLGQPVDGPAPAPAATATAAPAVEDAKIVSKPAGISYDDEVKPLLIKALQDPAIGMPKVQAVLKGFGVAKGADVKAADLPRFKGAIEALFNATTEDALL